MEDTTIEIFEDYEDFAMLVSKVKLRNYQGLVRCGRVEATGCDMGAYFCAISKNKVPTLEDAIPILFLTSLFHWEGWDEAYDPVAKHGEEAWRKDLINFWVPDWFEPLESENGKIHPIPHQYVDEMTHWSCADNLRGNALTTESKQTIRCGNSEDSYYYFYYVETETEFVAFNSWLTD